MPQDIVADMSSPATKGKIDRDQRESLMASSRKNDRISKIEKAKEMENQDFIDNNSPQVVRNLIPFSIIIIIFILFYLFIFFFFFLHPAHEAAG